MQVLLLPIFSIMSILAEPIIHVFFQRFAFDSSARAQVYNLFLACEYKNNSHFFCHGVGKFFKYVKDTMFLHFPYLDRSFSSH